MFTRDTLITMCDGHPEQIGPMADLPGTVTISIGMDLPVFLP
jgi:hypothetical protein